jgi:hypothetical protein
MEPLPTAVHVLEAEQEMRSGGLDVKKVNAHVAPPSVV